MEDLISWLLDSPTPSLRYLTFRRLLGYDEAHPDVQTTRQAMCTSGPIPLILSHQTPAGHWESDARYYGIKYVGTHWSMILLHELAADPDHPGLRRGVEFMLAATDKNYMLQDRFGPEVPSPEAYGFTCLWANLLRYAATCGYADDPRITPIIDYVVRNLEVGRCQCEMNGFLPCSWGAIRSLWGLAALPNRTEAVNHAIQKTLGFLLDSGYELVEGRYPTPWKIHKLWGKLSFPLFYQADVLFTLRLLGELNALAHPGAGRALDWLETQRGANGRWRGGSPYSTRTWKIAGDTQDTNRWVSLHAAIVMQQAAAQHEPH